jgi:hypothetical protein
LIDETYLKRVVEGVGQEDPDPVAGNTLSRGDIAAEEQKEEEQQAVRRLWGWHTIIMKYNLYDKHGS